MRKKERGGEERRGEEGREEIFIYLSAIIRSDGNFCKCSCIKGQFEDLGKENGENSVSKGEREGRGKEGLPASQHRTNKG